MEVLIWKARRMLESRQKGRVLLRCPIALGREPVGPKEREGDGRTPEGTYYICLIKEAGKYGKSLGLSYPSPEDAARGFAAGRIDEGALGRRAPGMGKPGAPAVGHGAGRRDLPARGRHGFRLDAGLHRAGVSGHGPAV